MTHELNVARLERWASALGGAVLTAFGVKYARDEQWVPGAALAVAGGALMYRGASGYCPVYGAAGINTADGDTRAALGGSGGVNVDEGVMVNRPAAELYTFWRDLTQLPLFMDHLVSVVEVGMGRTHWVAKAPAGRTVEWDAEIINDIPDELIAWRTLEGSDVVSAGSVHFVSMPGRRGTEVRVRLQYDPPGGKVGATVAWLLGHDPSQTIHEDLRRFKQLTEAAEKA
jgi:uncharacterized membrane protein